MKKAILLLVACLCCWVGANGQTRTGKSATAKTQKTETARRRAVRLDGSPPNGLFSPAIVAGELVFTSGQIGVDPKTGQIVAGGIEQETEQVFRNLTAVLEAAGSSFAYPLEIPFRPSLK